MVVEEVIVDRNDNVDITLAIPIDSKATTEDSVSVQTLEHVQTLDRTVRVWRHTNISGRGRRHWNLHPLVRITD